MAGDMVSWSDYDSLGGMGGMNVQGGVLQGGLSSSGDVDALNKALAAGSDQDNPGAAPGEGFPLRTESLDETLFTTTYRAKDVKFWKMLYKDPAYNTVEEYNRLDEYGAGDAIFNEEGDLPVEDDSEYSRQYTTIKFMGTTRRVTHVATVVRTAHGAAVARETVSGTMFLLRQLERALFAGDSDLVSVQFDGLEKLLINAYGSTVLDDGALSGYENDLVIDCRGNPLTEDHIADLSERIIAEPNYGQPSDLWSTTGVLKDLSKIMYPKERVNLPAPVNGQAGVAIKSIVTPFGTIGLNYDIFQPDSKIAGSAVGKAALRPAAPTLGAPTSPAYAGSDTNYWTSTYAGVYFYKVVAGSRYGRSAATTSSAVTVSTDDQVSIGVTDNGPNTSYFEVYRSDLGGAASTCRSIMRVARSGATQTIVDLNRFLPNCSKGYMLSQQSDVLKWKQLAPFTRIPLATIDASVRWMQLLYGALQIMKPGYNGMFINIGKLATGANAA